MQTHYKGRDADKVSSLNDSFSGLQTNDRALQLKHTIKSGFASNGNSFNQYAVAFKPF